MPDEMSEPILNHVYTNRIDPDLVVKVTGIKNGYVFFVFLKGLPSGYPDPNRDHKMLHDQFAKYYQLF